MHSVLMIPVIYSYSLIAAQFDIKPAGELGWMDGDTGSGAVWAGGENCQFTIKATA